MLGSNLLALVIYLCKRLVLIYTPDRDNVYMTKKSKLLTNYFTSLSVLMLGFSVAVLSAFISPGVVLAQTNDAKSKDNICTSKDIANPDPQNPCKPDPNELKSTPDSAAKNCTGDDCSGLIEKYINPLIKLLSGLVGVLVVISIIVAGIQYSSAGGDPSKVVAARKRITTAIIALLAYLFMFAFLQWLLPGGIV